MLEKKTWANEPHLAIQFQDLKQQEEASTLGMWLFLATEILFFGGLFLTYTVYRVTYPETFARAGKEFNVAIGTINTAVLLLSSYFMALAVKAIKRDEVKKAMTFLAGTWSLGFIFLIFKAYEYYDDVQKHIVPTMNIAYAGPNQGVARMLYFIYYAMTGLHAFHLIVGLGVVAFVFRQTRKNEYSAAYYNPVEVTGLYWHFIDVVWIFLYPLLYLMDRHP